MAEWVLGVVGGSGLYDIPGMEGQWRHVTSPWGEASDAVFDGVVDGQRVVFLPRHGRGHRLSPSGINYRANIDVLKRCGVTDVVSLSAVGSLREALNPGSFVVVDQFIDRTVAHAVCPRLADLVADAARAAGARTIVGGTYLAMEGPQFSSKAESELYRSWGCDVIGMTNMPEAKLAREAELPYASVAMVTDFDCWHEGHGAVEVSAILDVMHSNSSRAKTLVAALAKALSGRKRAPSPIDTCLNGAIITALEARDPELVAKLDAVAGRALRG
jgi:5'-methylthioadenosine phosphorylase